MDPAWDGKAGEARDPCLGLIGWELEVVLEFTAVPRDPSIPAPSAVRGHSDNRRTRQLEEADRGTFHIIPPSTSSPENSTPQIRH